MITSDQQVEAVACDSLDYARIDELWAQVPDEFRVWTYDLRQPPFVRLFRGDTARCVEFEVTGLTVSVCRELAWWVWSCPIRGGRRVELAAWQRLIEGLRVSGDRAPVRSVVDVDPKELLNASSVSFHQRWHRLPGKESIKKLKNELHLLQAALRRVYSRMPWWDDDIWAPRDDPRIPVRTHEPLRSQAISFLRVQPSWLRASLKMYARVSLESEALTWGTIHNRVVHLAGNFAAFVAERGLQGPALVDRPEVQLRDLMLDFQGWLRTRPGRHGAGTLAPLTVAQTKVSVRCFYEFLVDHREELAETTGDQRFLELSGAHLRLWRPTDGPSRRRQASTTAEGYIEEGDLTQMIDGVAVLGLPKDQTTTVTSGGHARTVAGLGDPSGMRAWLIQALTGRRANEILMLDFDPLLPVPGLTEAPAPPGPAHEASSSREDDEEFIAKLRYQQTKIDGAPDTILVGSDVVALITQQQEWVRERLRNAPGQPEPVYLFPGLNHNAQGTSHRSISGYHTTLKKLTRRVGLVDRQGRILNFSKSHRLRHTKATTLLNLGVPLHVVMRYMGHLSPEMTLLYGKTLAETAEREFLRARKLGHDGRELEISPRDMYDMVSLSTRTDRVLPTGVCLLPPTKRCDRGNACYSCAHFATDITFLGDHRELFAATERLVEQRAAQHQARTGRPMTDDNVWLVEQHATIAALRNLITRLETLECGQAAKGAGCSPPRQGPVPIELTRPAPEPHHG